MSMRYTNNTHHRDFSLSICVFSSIAHGTIALLKVVWTVLQVMLHKDLCYADRMLHSACQIVRLPLASLLTRDCTYIPRYVASPAVVFLLLFDNKNVH